MWALFILQTKSFFKSAGSIFTFVLPLLLLLILGYTVPAGWIVPSVISIGILSTALFQFGTSLEEIKRTAFMKQVGLTKLTKFTTFSTFLIFTILVTLLGIAWVLFWSWFLTTPVPFLSEDWGALVPWLPPFLTQLRWEYVQWWTVFYSWIINITLSFAIAFFFLSITKTSESYNFLSIGYIFIVLFLGGVVLPDFIVKLGEGSDWIKYGYYITPHYYINSFSISAFGGGVVGATQGYESVFGLLLNVISLLGEVDSETGLTSGAAFVNQILGYAGLQGPWSMEEPILIARIFAPLLFIVVFAGAGTMLFKWGD